MGILIDGESRTAFAFGTNEGTGYTAAFLGLRVGLFEGTDDEGTDGRTGTFRAVAEAVVEGLRDIDGGSDRHDMIMSQNRSAVVMGSQVREFGHFGYAQCRLRAPGFLMRAGWGPGPLPKDGTLGRKYGSL